MKPILIILLLIFCVSCSISQGVIDKQNWTKENFDDQQYHQDRYRCEQESYLYAAPVAHGGGIIPTLIAADRRVTRFGQCMRIKGYYRIK